VIKFDAAGEVLWEAGFVENDWTYSSAVWLVPSGGFLVTGLTGIIEHICDHCPNAFPKSILMARFNSGGGQPSVYLKNVTIPASRWADSHNIKYARGEADYVYATVSTFLDSKPTDCYTLKFDLSKTLAMPSVSNVPRTYALHQNYPNPFNPATTIRYELPKAATVRLIIYDLQGRDVARLIDGYRQSGFHEAVWDGRDADGRALPSGIYIAWMMTPAYSKSIKMVLLK
jgi:hypothetical protein